MKKVRILIIEDNRLLREGITAMVNKQPDLGVVAALDNYEKIEPKIRETKPDIILNDLGLQGKDNLQFVKFTNKIFPEIKIIVMDLLPLHGDIFEYVKAGAAGFILKDAKVNDFLKTIQSVFKGGKVLPTHLMGSLFSQIVSDATTSLTQSRLIRSVRMTIREKQVIASVADGLSNKEIGQKLHLSPYTVKSHVHNILEKLAMHNRIEITRYAHSGEGFIDIMPSNRLNFNKD